MREKVFCTEVVNSLRSQGYWAYKIPDAPVSATEHITRFTGKKPFDIVAVCGGHAVAIECKQIKKWQSFGIKHMRPSQIENLTAFERSGGKAYVFLNVRIPGIPSRLLVFNWKDLRWMPKNFKTSEIQEWPSVLGKKGLYPIKIK